MIRWTALLFLPLVSTLDAQPAAASDVVYTKQPRFRIPYHSEPAELQRLGAREIQLYVSTDRGLTWNLAQAVPPTAGRFAYEAPSDGEYWFAVRTLDGLGRLHPQAGEIAPGLKVAVDSRPPALELTLDRTGDQVRLAWRASDVNLDAATLKLEYRQPGANAWQPLQVTVQAAGQTSWTAPATGVVSVRGSIADHAGNAGTDEADLETGAAGYAPLPENPALEGPIAEQSTKPAIVPFHMASNRSETVPEQLASSVAANPVVQSRPPVEANTKSTAVPKPDGAANSRKEVVGTRAFNVGYQVDDVGPSGLGAVEFFITEDGGQKWFRYGADSDLKSPFRIDVPAEGTYGFKVRALSGVGLAAEPPKAGEQPAVTVVVDQTPPVATIQAPMQSSGEKSPVLQIRWKVQDANPLKTKAIDLEHGPSPDGPWTPIAKELDDQGGFDWTVTSIPAARLFLRLTARDAAGNAGHAVTSQPVTVDNTLPSARITDIEIQPIK
ncbi:MAG: hypothetical protein WBC44_15805 [Planctomycetaceae bacterium]